MSATIAHPIPIRPPLAAALALVLLAAAGCGREDIRVYRIAKEGAASEPGRATAASSAAAKPEIHWDTPAGWTAKPSGGVRVGSFDVTGPGGAKADVSVVPLEGGSGSELDNVNLWRGQVGLEPATEADLPKLGQSVEIDGSPATLYDFSGTPSGKSAPERVLAASLDRSGAEWFFKMAGDAATVTAQKDTFVGFLKSVHFHAPGESHDHGAEPATSTPTSTTKSEWRAPASWTEAAPGMMQQAKFLVAGSDGARAEVAVSIFPNDAGGVLANVNRWRGQLGLGPITQGDLPGLISMRESASGPLTVVDLSNAGTNFVGAIVRRGAETWYFRLTGPAALAERERAAFLEFAAEPQ